MLFSHKNFLNLYFFTYIFYLGPVVSEHNEEEEEKEEKGFELVGSNTRRHGTTWVAWNDY